MDYTVHGILQARTLEWVAFPFSRDLPDPGIEPRSPTLQVDSLPAEPQGIGEPMGKGLGPASDCRYWKGNIQPSACPYGLKDGTLSF